MLLVSCLAISAASAADINNTNDAVLSDTSDLELKAISEADLLSNNTNNIELTVSTNATPYNENATIEVSIADTDTSKDYNGSVVLLAIDGKNVNNITLNSEGKGSYIIPASTYEVGTYHVEGVYQTENDQIIIEDTILNITKVTPIVSVENVTVKTGEAVTIPFNVTDNKGKRIAGGVIVTIFWENDSLSKYVEIDEGKGAADFNLGELIGIFSNSNGTFNISSLFNGTGINISSLFNGSSINLGNLTNGTSLNISSLFNGTSLNISSLFNGTSIDLGSLLNGTTIDISSIINRNSTSDSTDVLGASIDIDTSSLINGTSIDLGSLFNGTSIDISSLFNGTSIDTSSLFNGTSIDLSSLLNGTSIDLGNLTNGTIDISSLLNGTSIGNTSINTSGIADALSKILKDNTQVTFNYIFVPGTYNVTVTYLGNRNYNKAINDTAKLIIVPRANITADNVIMRYKDGSKYIVNLTDYEGNPLANETITILINGQSYNRTTDNNGTASLAINLESGNYTVSASYTAKGDYFTNTVENNITVLTSIDGNDIVKMFKNDTQYYATFFDEQGKALPKDTTVTFNINGVMYERKVNENGTAKLNINLGAGEYIITATNPVTGEKHSNNITVLSYIQSSDLVKYYKNESQYVVTILGKDGKAVGAGETVTFNINGVFYTRQTNASGQAKLNINLMPGNYVITAEYKDCKVSNNIEVLSILTATDLVKSTSETKAFGAKLVDGQGNPLANKTVNFNINGVTYNRVTDSQGIAKLNINLQKGEYIITSSYNGQNIANTITVTE
ncbi:carboxypeptidase regulatory-like domain-containing protein [Methanobrevibacter millerae]|uniref:Adhesin-like protein n=1 Tax=Methanobrevibacter millerae TaxID=230361 RepID=A0A0U2V5Q7_9EURY|nr:carboxypeptidase regulatory-like domain-containing protein [Methanobrevibacter millerae]ALT69650.1 adhesin-like protein [Methanobrevibacter millerae]